MSGLAGDELAQPVPLGLIVQQLVPPLVPHHLLQPFPAEDRHPGIHVVAHLAQHAQPVVQPAKDRQSGGEGAAHGHDGKAFLGGRCHLRQEASRGKRIGGVEGGLEPAGLVTLEPEQLLQLGRRDRTGRARHPASVADPGEALGQPGVPAAPFQGGRQGIHCPNDSRQIDGYGR